MIVVASAFTCGPLCGQRMDVLVPAYANPCCANGPAMWKSLIASAGDPKRNYQLHVIFNPGSGPGTAREPNFLTDDGGGPLAELRAAGAIIHGYVPTGFGGRPPSDVKSDVDAYLSGHYAGFVDGIFFDEMSNDLALTPYYETLQTYVKAAAPDARTFGNPGSNPFNPTGQSKHTLQDFLNSLDTIIVFEKTGAAYADAFSALPPVVKVGPSQIGHLVHTQTRWDSNLVRVASDRGAGFLYVTDDVFLDVGTDNPFDALPTYWNEFHVDVSRFNLMRDPSP